MSFWARGYVELWKRHQAKLQYKWVSCFSLAYCRVRVDDIVHLFKDSVDFDDFNEPMRPKYESKKLPKRENPRTGVSRDSIMKSSPIIHCFYFSETRTIY